MIGEKGQGAVSGVCKYHLLQFILNNLSYKSHQIRFRLSDWMALWVKYLDAEPEHLDTVGS